MTAKMGQDEELRELVEANRPEIEGRLGHYPLDREQVDDVLDRVLGVLTLRWKKISNRRRWLLDELDRQCLRMVEEGGAEETSDPEEKR